MEIPAKIVTINREDSTTTIGFADDEYNTSHYVLLSFDDAAPNEGPYIEVNDQKLGGYGMVRRIQLFDLSIAIELTEPGAKEFNAGTKIVISISPSVQNWPFLKATISALLQRWLPQR